MLHSINYSHVNPPYVPAEHRFRHNRVADVASWNKTPALFGDERGNTVGEPDVTVAPNLPDFGAESAWRQSESGPLVFALSDFAPASDSALFDAGDGATAPAVDALGTPRPQGVAVERHRARARAGGCGAAGSDDRDPRAPGALAPRDRSIAALP